MALLSTLLLSHVVEHGERDELATIDAGVHAFRRWLQIVWMFWVLCSWILREVAP
jgi:UDP-2,3-diacylglucosamine pyrophosphatase LpxH